MKLLPLVFAVLLGCGVATEDEKKPCDEHTEISALALSAKAYGSAGPVINATATLKDQCPEVKYQGIYALKQDTAPATCTDGDTKIAGASAGWSPNKYGTYFVRACVTTGNYTSTGVVSSVTVNPD